ncbi:Uncharacterised protein [uncultured Clostridium sp.]|nr:Uncharacterised protein [uncultured Clostridium sp.]SCJ46803.1 Uncharacterised protein [uncultured Clostridium sp.]
MQIIKFCDHIYDESTDEYIQILKIDDKDKVETIYGMDYAL